MRREAKTLAQAERGGEKAAASTSEEKMDDYEQVLVAEPMAKDPFPHLPRSTFVLGKFKHKYCNEDLLSVALPYFWEYFDKDSRSLRYSECCFPEELTQIFISATPSLECSSSWTS